MAQATENPAQPELTITRVFNAPRALVWKVWTDPAHALRWMGPRDVPVVAYENDARPGGRWRACLRAGETAYQPAGTEMWQGGTNIEIVAPERLVFTFKWEDPDALETVVTVTLAEEDGKTRMTFHQAPFASEDSRDGHREGWQDSFDRLAELLGGMQ